MSSIVVGAGMAGMTCAMRLRDTGHPCELISDTIGGRICYRTDLRMNFGAVFYMQGYVHAREILTAGEPVLPSFFDLECHKQLGRGYGVASSTMMRAVPQLLHFLRYLKGSFMPRYAEFKHKLETKDFPQALAEHPYIADLLAMSAEDLIRTEGFPIAADAVVSQFVYACTGSKMSVLNALDYLNTAQGLIDTAMRFTFDAEGMQAQLSKEPGTVSIAHVVTVAREAGRWCVRTDDGKAHTADNLVMATPANVTRDLLQPLVGPYDIRNASKLYAYKVAGHIKREYAGHALHLFDEGIPLINIGARPDGDYEVFTCVPMDMSLFFDSYEVIHRQDWPYALFTNPSTILKQDLGDGLYRIGDHNSLGLEPAAISGVFAANRILAREPID